jgi:hypothetical protein
MARPLIALTSARVVFRCMESAPQVFPEKLQRPAKPVSSAGRDFFRDSLSAHSP